MMDNMIHDTYIHNDYNVTLWLFNIAMENDPFIDDVPIKTSICSGCSMAMLNNQMVYPTLIFYCGSNNHEPNGVYTRNKSHIIISHQY